VSPWARGERRRVGRYALVACLLGAPLGSTIAEGPFRYYKDGDHYVITNQPVSGAKPVPSRRPARRVRSSLPPTPYDGFIERLASEYGLSPDLIKSVAMVESAFDPHAVSPKGAQGLMQLMPVTAKQYGVRDAFDPLENLRAGARHLRHLLDQFDGDVTLALAAYNAGASVVRRHGGVPDYRETRDYVRRVHDSMDRAPRGSRPLAAPRGAPIRVERSPDGSLKLVN